MHGDNSGIEYMDQSKEKISYKHMLENASFISYPPYRFLLLFFFTK